MSEFATLADLKKVWICEKTTGNEIRLTGYKGNDRDIVVPSIAGKNVITELGPWIFSPDKDRRPEKTKPYFRIGIDSVTIPDTVRKIGFCAFENCKGLKRVILPETLEEIDDYAFKGCLELEQFSLPKNLKRLGYNVFTECNFTSFTIPKTLEDISDERHPFVFCPSITDIKVEADNPNYCDLHGAIYTKDIKKLVYCPPYISGVYKVPDGVTHICSNAFGACDKITEVILPDTLKSFGNGAFCEHIVDRDQYSGYTSEFRYITDSLSDKYGVYNFNIVKGLSSRCGIKKITIPEGVTELPYATFAYCKNLREVNLPSTLKKIGMKAFHYANIDEIVLPHGLEEIGSQAMGGCKNEEIVLPESVVKLDKDCFKGYGKLFGADTTSGYSKLKKIKIPKNITEIPAGCFMFCEKLETVILHDNVKKIGLDAFAGCCNLKGIDLPESIEVIDSGAFEFSGYEKFTVTKNFKKLSCIFKRCNDLKVLKIENSQVIDWEIIENSRTSSPYVETLIFKVDSIKGGADPERWWSYFKDYIHLKDLYIYSDTLDIEWFLKHNNRWSHSYDNYAEVEIKERPFKVHVPKGSVAEQNAKAMEFPVEYI